MRTKYQDMQSESNLSNHGNANRVCGKYCAVTNSVCVRCDVSSAGESMIDPQEWGNETSSHSSLI